MVLRRASANVTGDDGDSTLGTVDPYADCGATPEAPAPLAGVSWSWFAGQTATYRGTAAPARARLAAAARFHTVLRQLAGAADYLRQLVALYCPHHLTDAEREIREGLQLAFVGDLAACLETLADWQAVVEAAVTAPRGYQWPAMSDGVFDPPAEALRHEAAAHSPIERMMGQGEWRREGPPTPNSRTPS